ncbi:glutamine amidotransferase-related protein [Thauera sinica]|uniref:Glutamine amidotransferase domain-containing protein n=1 Tax=Thauera sinica TaxID=2665146 RepID=A0ABW1AX27_9RHOO|nr:hypothetical protein [Thauera sp. K11]ATE61204.1 hypothetical protein CCZ27_15770 [Thauera sp. K11]
MKRFALVSCSERLGEEFQHMLLACFAGEGEQWNVLSPADPDFAEAAAGYDGYVLSGSEKSVMDDAHTPPVQRLLEWLRHRALPSGSPVLGICFGAQALAAAGGGKVGRNPGGGFRLGVESIRWNDAASRWPEAAQPAAIVASHGECVLDLPPGGVGLASSASIPHEVFLVGDRVLGIQGHPEMSAHALKSHFMPLHRPLFPAQAWQAVEREAELPLQRDGMVALGRRLLAQGRL